MFRRFLANNLETIVVTTRYYQDDFYNSEFHKAYRVGLYTYWGRQKLHIVIEGVDL